MKVQQIEPEVKDPLELALNTTMNRLEKNWAPMYAPSSTTMRFHRFVYPENEVRKLAL